jgi:diguanylate cyclase (GGDEF)-like protein
MDQAVACLVVTYGAELGRRFLLDRPEVVIGRSRGCDILLEQDSTSRRHAVVRFTGGRYHVQDMGSTNGTCVNDETVSDSRIEDGDELRLGRTVLRFLAGDDLETKYREVLVAIARMDGLTGALTESTFHETLVDECARARRYDRSVAVAIFDLGDWDAYADAAGRIYSDLRLRRIAQAVQGKLRSSDKLARMGEARFALLLPECDLAEAQKCAERFASLFATELDGLHLTVGVSASSGTDLLGAALVEGALAKLRASPSPAAEIEAPA